MCVNILNYISSFIDNYEAVMKKSSHVSRSQQSIHIASYNKQKDTSVFRNNGTVINSPEKGSAGLQAWVDGPSTSQLTPRSRSYPSKSLLASPRDKSPSGSPKKSPRLKARPVSDASLSSTNSQVLWRNLAERNRNPHRLNLDRKRLTRCYQIKKEPDLEVINYQHNSIDVIEFARGFKKLIFLDFYDNRIEEIGGLEKLPSLKVLLLGKNQIRQINGLENVSSLDMLDLHSNLINKIQNLNHLKNLRVLNLSGNLLTKVQNLDGLVSLVELNLRRNRIQFVSDFSKTPQLEKLYLSYNDLNSLQELLEQLEACSETLQDVTLDGNPLCQSQSYKTTVLKNLPKLKQLDMRRITENEREVINRAIQKEKIKEIKQKEKAEKELERNKKILAAQSLWETQQLQLPPVSKPADRLAAAGSTDFETEKTVIFGHLKPSGAGEQGYAEILLNVLKFYGKDSLGALEKNWGFPAMNNVSAVKFKFVDFDYVAQTFVRLKIKFPHISTITLSNANLRTLQQIHSFQRLKRLYRLDVLEGNPILEFTFWKEYTAFVLESEIGLKIINDLELNDDFLARSKELFNPLRKTVAKLNPATKMIGLNCGGTLDKKDSYAYVKKIGPNELLQQIADGKKNRNLKKLQESAQHSRHLVREKLQETESELASEKKFAQLFPEVFDEFVTNVLADMTKFDADAYMKSRMHAFAQWEKG